MHIPLPCPSQLPMGPPPSLPRPALSYTSAGPPGSHVSPPQDGGPCFLTSKNPFSLGKSLNTPQEGRGMQIPLGQERVKDLALPWECVCLALACYFCGNVPFCFSFHAAHPRRPRCLWAPGKQVVSVGRGLGPRPWELGLCLPSWPRWVPPCPFPSSAPGGRWGAGELQRRESGAVAHPPACECVSLASLSEVCSPHSCLWT